jgi:C4-dicarboxylate-specific signal transduction histidine kinase
MMTDHNQEERCQRLARLLRHEVGDLLQSVYSTVAVLLERLPVEMAIERRLTSELKFRAELIKGELDAAVELASPQQPSSSDHADLTGAFTVALEQLRRRYPTLPIEGQAPPRLMVKADPLLLNQALCLILLGICQGSRKMLRITHELSDRHVTCTIYREGLPMPREQFGWLQTPFATTQQAPFGLGLALAKRAIQQGGGEIQTDNRPEGVFVQIRFPVCSV